jgi:hypothetical protein
VRVRLDRRRHPTGKDLKEGIARTEGRARIVSRRVELRHQIAHGTALTGEPRWNHPGTGPFRASAPSRWIPRKPHREGCHLRPRSTIQHDTEDETKSVNRLQNPWT